MTARVDRIPRAKLPHEGGEGTRWFYVLVVDGIERGGFFSRLAALDYLRVLEREAQGKPGIQSIDWSK